MKFSGTNLMNYGFGNNELSSLIHGLIKRKIEESTEN